MNKIVQTIVNVIKQSLSSINRILTIAAAVLTRTFNQFFGFLAPVKQLLKPTLNIARSTGRLLLNLIILSIPIIAISLLAGKIYQNMDRDPDRGAIAVETKSMGESYTTPVYVDQGWDASDSLWFYNTTQGSDLLPYDFFVELEVAESEEKFISPANIDALRYLPQKATFFNPDALPVGLVKDTYQNEDFVGPTCAACHTGQVNYEGNAVRIDGGPAGADMVGFLIALEAALAATIDDPAKFDRFSKAVIERNSFWRSIFGSKGYSDADKVKKDLEEWTNRTFVYNTLNSSEVPYGFSRLDAFGRIYNRVLEHVLESDQIANRMAFIVDSNENRLLSDKQIQLVLEGLDNLVIGQKGFELLVNRLYQPAPYPAFNLDQVLQVRDSLFNKADAPVSYPFLWDIAQSDFVQWNGLAGNAGLGPLGRNAGEVIGVFGTLDWKKRDAKWWEKFSFSALISGQSGKAETIDFKSSIDKSNLTRLESHLRLLQSPLWIDVAFADGSGLPEIDEKKAARGKQVYSQYCQACHEVIVRDDWDRLVIAKMMSLEKVGTDPKMAENGVNYRGSSGNFASTYQATDVGTVIIEEQAPVVQILTSATKGVIGTADPDKWPIRRFADWLYSLVGSLADNPIKTSIKSGDYNPDTTSNPYASLVAYKGRSLNGIWATAPYLHNGSVPTLYDLLLPNMAEGDPQGEGNEYRPDIFAVGCRELDAKKVGFKCADQQGQRFDTALLGNSNAGHEYAAGKTNPLGADQPLPALGSYDRWALVEYIKTL